MSDVHTTQMRDALAWATNEPEPTHEASSNPFVWFWEAVEGDFNENRTTNQILVDADEGLSEFNINTEIVEADLVSHDTARAKICSIIQNIAASGWKPTIPLGMARLRGKTLTNYLLRTEERTTLDPSYIPTLDEWMRLPNRTRWGFYANHSYLEVGFTREHTMTDPTKPGAYLLSFELKSEAEYFRRHADGAGRKRWKELVPVELRQLATARSEMEAELRKEGIAIDEDYVDPPVPDYLKK